MSFFVDVYIHKRMKFFGFTCTNVPVVVPVLKIQVKVRSTSSSDLLTLLRWLTPMWTGDRQKQMMSIFSNYPK
jgi:hypothetical protein